MKKKVLLLAGVLSCAMMIFSVQADNGQMTSSESDKEIHHHHHHHHHHTTVNVNPPTKVDNDKIGCYMKRDGKGLCCPGEPCYGNKDQPILPK